MIIFGHRGAAGEAPENTIAAVQHAIGLGITHFEIDIRLSADEELVVLHDSSLLRTSGIDRNIHDMQSKDLAGIEVQGRNGEKTRGIPTLESLLDQCPQIELIQLELKSDKTTDKPLLIKRLGEMFPDTASTRHIVATSFDAELLQSLKNQLPHMPIGFVNHSDTMDALSTANTLECRFLCLLYKLVRHWDAKVINAIRQSGLHVSLWTVNEPDFLDEIANLPVDSIITDFPSRFSLFR